MVIATLIVSCVLYISQAEPHPGTLEEQLIHTASGTQGSLIALLTNREVKADLGLNADQITKVRELLAERQRLRATEGEFYSGIDARQVLRQMLLANEFDVTACDLLTPEQRRRLMQIYAQRQARENNWWDSFVLSKQSTAELELTPSQVESITAKATIRRERFWATVEDYFSKCRQMEIEHRDKVLDRVFSRQQKGTYHAHYGEPLSFNTEQLPVLNAVFSAINAARRHEDVASIAPELSMDFRVQAMPPGTVLSLLGTPLVARELRLDELQQEGLDALKQSRMVRVDVARKAVNSTDADVLLKGADATKKTLAEVDQEVWALLSERQSIRLRQLLAQYEAQYDHLFLGTRMEAIRGILQLSEAQQTIIESDAKRLQETYIGMFPQLRARILESEAIGHRDVMGVLNETQVQKYEDIFGAPFKPRNESASQAHAEYKQRIREINSKQP